jgi:hypothetical protein
LIEKVVSSSFSFLVTSSVGKLKHTNHGGKNSFR